MKLSENRRNPGKLRVKAKGGTPPPARPPAAAAQLSPGDNFRFHTFYTWNFTRKIHAILHFFLKNHRNENRMQRPKFHVHSLATLKKKKKKQHSVSGLEKYRSPLMAQSNTVPEVSSEFPENTHIFMPSTFHEHQLFSRIAGITAHTISSGTHFWTTFQHKY